MFENGIYCYNGDLYVVVLDGNALSYRIGWYGDLSAFEISKGRDIVDVSDCVDEADIIKTACHLHWNPDPDLIEVVTASEGFPFNDVPEVHPEGYANAMMDYGNGSDFIDWLYDEGLFIED